MDSQYERKLNRAKELIEQIKNGTDPINNVKLPDDNFLRDEKMQNLFGFIDDVLTNEIYSMLPKIKFYITPDEIKNLDVIGGDMTVTDFADYINSSIFLRNRKKLRPTHINSILRELGELKYEIINDKKRTRVSELGKENGIIETITKHNEREYIRISYGAKGIQHLKDILLMHFSDIEF